jgi:nucleoside-diphosphate-sugar epimerase
LARDVNSGGARGSSRHALVVGAGGLVGAHLVDRLLETGWEVTGISRRALDHESPRFHHLSVDVSDEARCIAAAPHLKSTTHLFFTARVGHRDPATETELNVRVLRNTLEHLVAHAGELQHVCLVHGTKWYGSHLGAFPNPAVEHQPRHAGPNWYFGQHDWMVEFQRGRRWTWSTVRPHIVVGLSLGQPYNCVSTLAAYATLCRERGLPFDFPGSEVAFNAITQATDATLLADAQIWSSVTASCANQDFNIINPDYFRWRQMWPAIADFFSIKPGVSGARPLRESMGDAQGDWERLVSRHRLRSTRLSDIASWTFGDFLFGTEWDVMSSMLKSRQHGFDAVIGTEASFLSHLARMREQRLIP